MASQWLLASRRHKGDDGIGAGQGPVNGSKSPLTVTHTQRTALTSSIPTPLHSCRDARPAVLAGASSTVAANLTKALNWRHSPEVAQASSLHHTCRVHPRAFEQRRFRE